MVHGYLINIFHIWIQIIQHGFIIVIHLKKNYYLKEILYNMNLLIMELFHHQQDIYLYQLEKKK